MTSRRASTTQASEHSVRTRCSSRGTDCRQNLCREVLPCLIETHRDDGETFPLHQWSYALTYSHHSDSRSPTPARNIMPGKLGTDYADKGEEGRNARFKGG